VKKEKKAPTLKLGLGGLSQRVKLPNNGSKKLEEPAQPAGAQWVYVGEES
jgi:hypothetical protein